MAVDEIQRRQQIVGEFRRRRAHEFVALIPGAAAFYVAYQSFHDPAFTVGGVSGRPLLIGAVLGVAAYFAHHLANWRCPSCGRHFMDGFFLSRCPRCGAVFTEPKGEVLTDPAAVEKERKAAALLAELESDRDNSGMTTMVGLAMLFLGLFTTFFIADSSEGPQPGGWLSQKLLMATFGIRKLAAIRRRYKRDYLGE